VSEIRFRICLVYSHNIGVRHFTKYHYSHAERELFCDQSRL